MADFTVENHGTIFLLRPLTVQAENWIEENLSDDRQNWGDATVVEHRFIAPIVEGILQEGFIVEHN